MIYFLDQTSTNLSNLSCKTFPCYCLRNISNGRQSITKWPHAAHYMRLNTFQFPINIAKYLREEFKITPRIIVSLSHLCTNCRYCFFSSFYLNASANWKKEVALLQNRLRKHLSCWSHNHVLFRTSQPISYSVIQKTNSSAMIYCSIYVILYIFHVSLGENFTNVHRV